MATGNVDTTISLEEKVTDLEKQLYEEKRKARIFEAEVAHLKSVIVNLQAAAEQEDEARVNRLSKDVEALKKDKQDLLRLVEQEEEYITNTLVKKLEQVRREKVEMENQVEQEEEFITNKLQKQLAAMQEEKRLLERKWETEQADQQKRLKAMEHEIESLRKEATSYEQDLSFLRNNLQSFSTERDSYQEKNDTVKDQLLRLKSENFALNQRIRREQERLSQVSSDKLVLMTNLEMDDERKYNMMSGKQQQNLRLRSVSLPPSPDPTKLKPKPHLPLTIHTRSATSSPVPSSSSTTTSTTTSSSSVVGPLISPRHIPTLNIPFSSGTIIPSCQSPTSPRHATGATSAHTPSHKEPPTWGKGRIIKDDPIRLKDNIMASPAGQQPHPMQRGFAVLRDTGVTQIIQIWKVEAAYINNAHSPDLIGHIDTLSSCILDKNDPRCLSLCFEAHPHHISQAVGLSQSPSGSNISSASNIVAISPRGSRVITSITLTFDREDQAQEWKGLLDELSASEPSS